MWRLDHYIHVGNVLAQQVPLAQSVHQVLLATRGVVWSLEFGEIVAVLLVLDPPERSHGVGAAPDQKRKLHTELSIVLFQSQLPVALQSQQNRCLKYVVRIVLW